MFVRSLLVVGMLVIYPVKEVIGSVSGNQDQMTMGGSDFVRDCNGLITSVGNQVDATARSNLWRKWREDVSPTLVGVCTGSVADYSVDVNTEIKRLVDEKYCGLVSKVGEFFGDLSEALKICKDSLGTLWFLFPSKRTKRDDLNGSLTELARLCTLLNGDDFKALVESCFRSAYNANMIRGCAELQEWFVFKKEGNHWFSEYLMESFDDRAMALSPSFQSPPDNATRQSIAGWKTQFKAMKALSLPQEALTNCSLDKSTLITRLQGFTKGYRVTEGWLNEIADGWLGAFNEGRCRFFIPAISVEGIKRFVRDSGIPYFNISVSELLICEDLSKLNEVLWGAPIKSDKTSRGLILSALMGKTSDAEKKSYLNATLIIEDLEELLEVTRVPKKYRHATYEYVDTIWNFFKFANTRDWKTVGPDEHYRFPYLGIDKADQDEGQISLDRFNVILSTQRMSFKEIGAALSKEDSENRRVVAPDSVEALERRMSLVVPVEKVESKSGEDKVNE